tara:strand:+ start:16 stop:768 length:753 start_codon:yes stop_codon:yes gene_type:complete
MDAKIKAIMQGKGLSEGGAAPSKKSSSIENIYEKIPKRMLDNAENPNFDLHHLKIPFRMCVVAPSGSGKTNFLVNVIAKFCQGNGTFNDITVITRNKDEPLYRFLKDKCDDIQILEGLNNTPVLDKMDKDLNHLVVFDDLVLEKNQERIKNYYIRARKLNCSVIYLSQSYFAIPKIIRNNCSYLVLLKLSGHREVNMILSEGGLGIDKDTLLRLYQEATNEKFSPFIIDYEESPEKRYRKGLLEVMPVNS